MTRNDRSKDPTDQALCHLSEPQLAELLNLSKGTLQGWRLKGEGPAFEKFGRAVRYAVPTIRAWVAERERSSTSASAPQPLCNTHQSDLLSISNRGDRS